LPDAAPGIGFHDEESGEAGIISVLRRMQAEGQLGYTGNSAERVQRTLAEHAVAVRTLR